MASFAAVARRRLLVGLWWLAAFLSILTVLAPDHAQAQQTPTISLVKSTSTPTFTAAGDILLYSYEVTNTGPFDIPDSVLLNVEDDKVDILGSVTCRAIPPGGLVPGDAVQCVGSYTVTAADVAAGSVTNVAQAHIDTCGDGGIGRSTLHSQPSGPSRRL